MSAGSIEDLVKYRLERSKQTIKEADVLIENKMWNAAVNRLYYACYYAVSSLLLRHGFQAKTHAGTRQLFALHFIDQGKVQVSTGRFYSKLFSKRQTGDYDDLVDYTESDVRVLLEPAKAMVNEIEDLLSS
ncbi:MAG: HEPN domain-containing protein [Bacteroidota bacterium]